MDAILWLQGENWNMTACHTGLLTCDATDMLLIPVVSICTESGHVKNARVMQMRKVEVCGVWMSSEKLVRMDQMKFCIYKTVNNIFYEISK